MKRREIRENYEYPVNLIMDIYGENAIKDLYNNDVPSDLRETMDYILDNLHSKNKSEILKLYWIDRKSAMKISQIKNCTASRIIQILDDAKRIILREYNYLIHVGITMYNTENGYVERIINGEKLAKPLIKKYDDISRLNIQERTYGCCKRAGINKITELKDALTNGSLKKVHHIGRTSIMEIANIFHYNIRDDKNYASYFKGFPEEEKSTLNVKKMINKINSLKNLIDTDAKYLEIDETTSKEISELIIRLNNVLNKNVKEI